MSIAIPSEYGYVIGAGVLSGFVMAYLGSQVGKMRKALGVPYPFMYASMTEAPEGSDKYLFNCYQRGHQNALENYPVMLFLLAAGGLKHPLISAGASTVWSLSRILYARGYATGKPENRQRGVFGMLGLIALIGTSISTALTLLNYI